MFQLRDLEGRRPSDDDAIDRLGMSPQPLGLLGMADQRERALGDQIGGRVVPGLKEKDRRRRDIVVREIGLGLLDRAGSEVPAAAVDALVSLARADRNRLSQSIYNISSFNPSAAEIRDLVLSGFPDAEITFAPDLKRQAIVDSWPADVDDSAARRDWGLAPRLDLERAFSEYLIPNIRDRYHQ